MKKIILASIVAVVLFMPVSIGIDAQPDSASSWNEKGASLFNQGKYSEALQAFDKAIELDPNFPEIWYNKGNALYSQHKYDEAVKAYNKVLELDPQYAYAWVAKGKSLSYLKKYDEAIRCFDNALVIDLQYADALTLRNSVLDALERATEAVTKTIESEPKPQFIAADERPIHFQPQDPIKAEEWNSRGIALLNQGNYQEAIKAFEEAISFDANNTVAWKNYWDIYFGNYRKEQLPKTVQERSGVTKLSGHEGETVFKDVAGTATLNFGSKTYGGTKADPGYVAQQTSGGWLDAPGF